MDLLRLPFTKNKKSMRREILNLLYAGFAFYSCCTLSQESSPPGFLSQGLEEMINAYHIEAVKADDRRRMNQPQRLSVARIVEELGVHVITLYKWGKASRLQGKVVLITEKDPDGWSDSDKFTVVLESTGHNSTELTGSIRVRSL